MIILAIDPSVENCGWAVLDEVVSDRGAAPIRLDSGCWHPSKAKDAPNRFSQLGAFLSGLMTRHHPDCVVVEEPGSEQRMGGRGRKRSVGDLITYGQAVGIPKGIAGALFCEVHEARVRAWKGNSSKQQSFYVCKHRFGYETTNDNEADAIALGDWWLRVGRHYEKARSA